MVNEKRQYEAAVVDALKDKLMIDSSTDKVGIVQVMVTTLFKEPTGSVLNLTSNDGTSLPTMFSVTNGVPDISRYKIMNSGADKISSTSYNTIETLTGINGKTAIDGLKSDLISVETVLAEALEDAYSNGHKFIFTQGISYIYPNADSEGPIIITGIVDSNNEVIFKYATTSSINLAFKDDYAKIARI